MHQENIAVFAFNHQAWTFWLHRFPKDTSGSYSMSGVEVNNTRYFRAGCLNDLRGREVHGVILLSGYKNMREWREMMAYANVMMRAGGSDD